MPQAINQRSDIVLSAIAVNDAVANIAGICNRERNVAGLMPHPERSVESALGSTDGLVIFKSMIEALVGAAKATA